MGGGCSMGREGGGVKGPPGDGGGGGTVGKGVVLVGDHQYCQDVSMGLVAEWGGEVSSVAGTALGWWETTKFTQ